MIIKVPIYVEISKPISQENLSADILELSRRMSKVLRTNSSSPVWQDFNDFKDQKFEKASIIPRERAFEALRKGK